MGEEKVKRPRREGDVVLQGKIDKADKAIKYHEDMLKKAKKDKAENEQKLKEYLSNQDPEVKKAKREARQAKASLTADRSPEEVKKALALLDAQNAQATEEAQADETKTEDTAE